MSRPGRGAATYAGAGVDLDEAARAVDLIRRAAAGSLGPEVMAGVGGFGSLVRLDPARWPDPVLVASTDGVGTKLLVAIALDRYDTVGIDLVHHCLNDVAVQGADPLFFLDYLATGRLDADRVATIVGGMAAACAEAGVPLVGGETAELPGLYQGDAFDLAGFCVGVVARSRVVDGARVQAGDLLLGLPSSGLHTNGYSLVRSLFPVEEWASQPAGWDTSLGEALLVPHRLYLPDIRRLRGALEAAGSDVLAMAHLTGGGWVDNIPRTLPAGLGVEIEWGSWTVPPLFELIAQRSGMDRHELARTFNLGIGLTLVVRAEMAPIARRALPDAMIVGRVRSLAAGQPRVAFS